MKKKKNMTIFLIVVNTLLSFSAQAQIDKLQEINDTYKDPIKDIPHEIDYKYSIPMIPDEKTALEYAELVLKRRFSQVPFDDLKPFIVKLVAQERIWEIKVQVGNYANRYFLIRINKNNGEILNCWQEGK